MGLLYLSRQAERLLSAGGRGKITAPHLSSILADKILRNPAQFNANHLNIVFSENTLPHKFLPYVKKLTFKKIYSSKISTGDSDPK